MSQLPPRPSGPHGGYDPAFADPGSHMLLPCGCECWNQGGKDGQFVYVPCSPDCEYYRYALAETARLGQPAFRVQG